MSHFNLITLMLLFTLGCEQKVQYEKPMADEKNPVMKMQTTAGDIYIELFEKDAPMTVANFVELAEGKKEFTDAKTKQKVKRPFYDGLKFHRVIQNFMLQGGCPLGTGTGDPGYKFKDEINAVSLGLDSIKVQDAQYAVRDAQMYIGRKLNLQSQADVQARMAEIEQELAVVAEMNLAELYAATGYTYDSSLRSHKAVRGALAMANSGPNTNGSQFFINQVDTPWLDGKHTVFGQVVKGMDVVDKICNAPKNQQDQPTPEIKIVSMRVSQKSRH